MCGECNWPILKITPGVPGEILTSIEGITHWIPLPEPPTEITRKDLEETYDKVMKSAVFFPKCNWCNESHFVREVGPNYICPECESAERAAGRPLIFTSPVRNAYFEITEEK